MECRVSHGDDLEQVSQVTIEALRKLPNLLEDKEVKVYFTEFAESSINLVVMIWIKYDQHSDYLEGRSGAIMALKKAYDDADIMIPFPQYVLWILESGVARHLQKWWKVRLADSLLKERRIILLKVNSCF